jgi:hypothetical protein
MDSVSYPRMKLVVNGQTFNLKAAQVKQNGYFHAAKASATLPIWGDGGLTDEQWLELGGDGSNIDFVIYGGQGAADGSVTWNDAPLFDGILLGKDLNIAQNEVKLTAVDRTQLLIQYKLFAAYPNKSGEEVINQLAGAVGLSTQISGSTELIGTLYSAAHMKLHQGEFSKVTVAWDLICDIARQSGNVAFVKGKVLYIEPNVPDQASAWTIYYSAPRVVDNISYWDTPSNVDSLEIKHNLLAAKDITVEVTYFHSKKGKPGVARAGTQKNRNVANQSNYQFGPYPNLSPDEAQQKANQLYRDLTIHEYTLDFTAPADFTLTPYKTVLINNTSGEMAQTFWVNELTFDFSVDSGAKMACIAKNHVAQNDTSA